MRGLNLSFGAYEKRSCIRLVSLLVSQDWEFRNFLRFMSNLTLSKIWQPLPAPKRLSIG